MIYIDYPVDWLDPWQAGKLPLRLSQLYPQRRVTVHAQVC